MIEFIKHCLNNETLLWSLGVVSAVMFIASLIIIPYLAVRIPQDYFASEQRPENEWSQHHVIVRFVLILLKNTAGVIFIILGIAMLVLPGQGLLTILIGLCCLDFPGKYRFQRYFIQKKSIRQSIDWLRLKAGRQPLDYGEIE